MLSQDKPGEATKSKPSSKWLNLAIALLAYPTGDLVGQLILGDGVNVYRLVGVMVAGLIFYQFEVPNWFKFLDHLSFNDQSRWLVTAITRPVERNKRKLNWIGKTLGAMLYFNPLWIARHVFIISFATTPFVEFDFVNVLFQSLEIGLKSFFTNLPISIVGNFVVQQCLPLHLRFFGSSVLTMVFNIKYAVEYRYFS